MFLKLEIDGSIQSVKSGHSGPAVTHLLFANDILICCRANRENIIAVAKCLAKNCKWTGQLINLEKSGCFLQEHKSEV